MKNNEVLRDHVLALLAEDSAHAKFDTVVENFPADLRGKRPKGSEYSAWELLEHLRIAQSDILEFSRNPQHASPEWPKGYWPHEASPPSEKAWDDSVKAFRADLKGMAKLVSDPAIDLLAPIPHAEGKTLLREALLLADHNSYHLGQLVLVRRLLGAWKS